MAELKLRMDAIPTSLAIARAAKEVAGAHQICT